jgi:hypothetical protein
MIGRGALLGAGGLGLARPMGYDVFLDEQR